MYWSVHGLMIRSASLRKRLRISNLESHPCLAKQQQVANGRKLGDGAVSMFERLRAPYGAHSNTETSQKGEAQV
jgi:hypothetical protein